MTTAQNVKNGHPGKHFYPMTKRQTERLAWIKTTR